MITIPTPPGRDATVAEINAHARVMRQQYVDMLAKLMDAELVAQVVDGILGIEQGRTMRLLRWQAGESPLHAAPALVAAANIISIKWTEAS